MIPWGETLGDGIFEWYRNGKRSQYFDNYEP